MNDSPNKPRSQKGSDSLSNEAMTVAAQHDPSQHARVYHNLKLRILVPVVGAIVVVLGCGLFGMYRQDHQDIDDVVNARINATQRVFSTQLDQDTALLSGFQQFISENESLKKAWLSGDRDELLRQATPIFQRIKETNRITHFYFIGLDQVCFLRVHRPSHFGDKIERYTMKEAVRSKTTACGIELGKYGHFTLRVVQPWIIDGKLAGYLELGEEIEHITPKLSETLGVDVVFAIEKKFLNQSDWEEGSSMMGRLVDWGQLSNFVVIDKTIGEITPELAALIDSGKRGDAQISLTDRAAKRIYRGGVVPLVDVGKRQVGSLVVIKDITQQAAELRIVSGLLLAVGLVVGGVLFTVCYIYISTLREVSEQLVNTAREAGKAEIATSVLHNVGNVLNSMNVSANLIQEKFLEAGTSHLTKAVGVMEEHLDDLGNFVTHDERGKHLPQFLIDVSYQMASEEEMLLEEVKSLIGNIDHIKAVVTSQQKHAKSLSGVVERTSLTDLLEDAIHINTASMQRHSVSITREFEDVPPVYVDKQTLLQVIVNLISNAKYACMESGSDSHQMTVSLRQKDERHVSIKVQDNGMGIAPENLTKIFAHGFTTRREGHGFGLHSAALAAKELGGNLTATSKGPGTGATFTLEIPMKQARAAVL